MNDKKPPTTLKQMKTVIARPITSGLIATFHLKKILFFKKHECILIACMPKSGSTFLLNTLSILTGFKIYKPHNGGGRNEQNLYLPNLIEIYGRKGVCQLHLKATEQNLNLIDKFSIKPIILVRNIFDVVISYRDHLYKESTNAPMVWSNDEFFKLNQTSQIDFIIELAIPWYINFYVSWFSAIEEGIVNPIWLTYEEFTSNPHSTLRLIMDSYCIKKTDKEIVNSLQLVGQKKTRYNKGVTGRGQLTLTDAQIQKIIDFTRFYPWVDFSKIGIPK